MKQPKAYIEELGIVADVTAINYLEKEVEVYIEQNAVFDDPSLGFDFYSFDEVIFMENTGFKDRNGTSIFVGDIVKDKSCFDKNIVDLRVVKKSELFHNAYTLFEEDSKEIFDLGNQKYTEVIGNIYENKELLEIR